MNAPASLAAPPDLDSLLERTTRLREQVARVIVGQERVLTEILVTLLSGGHALLRGVPGLAKTLIVRTVADATHLDFRRVQFTPDLLPSDVTGSEILSPGAGTPLTFLPGPVFTNLLLADEINRTAPKTQAALLEAMQERQVTAGGVTHRLPEPFSVLATQNPIEQEGTYPLPEAELDRFLLCIAVEYPPADDEVAIVRMTTGSSAADVEPVLEAGDVLDLQRVVRDVAAADELIRAAVDVVRRSRPGPDTPKEIARFVEWGVGPRGGQAWLLAAKARALLDGRFAVDRSDLRALAAPVLRHRLVLSYAATAEGVGPDEIVERLLGASRI